MSARRTSKKDERYAALVRRLQQDNAQLIEAAALFNDEANEFMEEADALRVRVEELTEALRELQPPSLK